METKMNIVRMKRTGSAFGLVPVADFLVCSAVAAAGAEL